MLGHLIHFSALTQAQLYEMILDILVYPDLYHDSDIGFTAFTCNLF